MSPEYYFTYLPAGPNNSFMITSGFIHHKHSTLLASLLYWACAVFLLLSFADNRSEYLKSEQEEGIRREVALVRAKLEAKIFEHIYKAESLATVITIDPDFALKRWDQIAKKLLQQTPYVRNIGAAPDNIMRYVYPLEGNEKALGFDFRTNPRQYASVLKAKSLGSVYLDGPLELVQGGQAVIARFPIFRDYPLNTDYWGSVSVVLDYGKLLADTGIYTLNNASVAIQRPYPKSPEPVTFFGEAEVFNQADLMLPIHLPNTEWVLAARFTHLSPDLSLVYLLGLGGFSLLYTSLLALVRAYRISHNASLQDELTHLPNRRFVISYLEKHTSEKASTDFTLLNIDLNNFKVINDSLGHHTGDLLLQHIARHLRGAVRKQDVVSRIGGDEFLIILASVRHESEVTQHIERIRAHLARHPLELGDRVLEPSLSIGYAIFRRKKPRTIEELLNIADRHMYENKKAAKAGHPLST
ncbi:diguanylate cyclase (GGDEF) domain-containing protein [Oceanospirillum linum]|nr:diguanylate cyclase (GGDEF) domain-containing protein [Oleiphilus messinensis]SMP27917.1 diguanylate cyclase (GGDEF) domain-containing protein [Oceanospirillum linum]